MRIRGLLRTFAIASVAGLLAFIALGAAFCAATLRGSRVVWQPPLGAGTVEITAKDGSRLSAWWIKPAQATGNCVVVLHGIKGSKASSVRFAPMFLGDGYSVLAPDSRAHGASGGDLVTYGRLEKFDVIGWTHWMQRQGCTKVYGFGQSLGASILIQAAAIEPAFAAVVAECPYADLRDLAEYRVRRISRLPDVLASPVAKVTVASGIFYARARDGLDLTRVAPLESIARTSTPILLIHGLADTRTPPSHSRKLAAANPQCELWLVPGADHIRASSVAPEEFRKRVLEWFHRH